MRKLLTGLGALLAFLTAQILARTEPAILNIGMSFAIFCSAAAIGIIVGEWSNHKVHKVKIAEMVTSYECPSCLTKKDPWIPGKTNEV